MTHERDGHLARTTLEQASKWADQLLEPDDRRRGAHAGTGASIGAALGSCVGGSTGAAIGAGIGSVTGVLLGEKLDTRGGRR